MNRSFKIAIIILGILITNTATAQSLDRQVFSNAGEQQESSSYTLNFTIGEPITSYEENGSFKLTQGFQHASLNSNQETAINEKEITIDYKFFPNPATDFIQLEFSNLGINTLKIEIVNTMGQVQIQDIFFKEGSEKQKIDISRLPKGHFFIYIKNEKTNLLNTINFIKH